MECLSVAELNPSPRILMGPGPSNVNYRVLRAMSHASDGAFGSRIPYPHGRDVRDVERIYSKQRID